MYSIFSTTYYIHSTYLKTLQVLILTWALDLESTPLL